MQSRIIHGDCLAVLRDMPAQSIQTCVTSPPYWGLRDYGVPGQLGLESTPQEYVSRLVEIFREVRRVLRDDGTLWLNLGDSYSASTRGAGGKGKQHTNTGSVITDRKWTIADGLKPKDLVGVPWRVAFALQADGWYLRSDIIWAKPNPMPESVTDRPTKAHEYIFLLSKSERYFYDAHAVMEASAKPAGEPVSIGQIKTKTTPGQRPHAGTLGAEVTRGGSRNRRTVWTVTPQPFKGAHFATFPPKLIEPCILAGSRIGDTVLDPFNGAGTSGVVAKQHGRSYIGIELNAEYIAMSEARIGSINQ
jgi:DNA modification methylase